LSADAIQPWVPGFGLNRIWKTEDIFEFIHFGILLFDKYELYAFHHVVDPHYYLHIPTKNGFLRFKMYKKRTLLFVQLRFEHNIVQ